MATDFDEIIYKQFVLIYGNSMQYDKGKVGVYVKMIVNYNKQQKSGQKVFISRYRER